MTDLEFYQAIHKGFSVAEFSSQDCSPCKIVSPALQELNTEFSDQVKFLKIDVEEHPRLALQLRVLGVPTVIMFQDGEPVDVLYSSYPKRVYRERILRQLEREHDQINNNP
jgi:thioredoxin 1